MLRRYEQRQTVADRLKKGFQYRLFRAYGRNSGVFVCLPGGTRPRKSGPRDNPYEPQDGKPAKIDQPSATSRRPGRRDGCMDVSVSFFKRTSGENKRFSDRSHPDLAPNLQYYTFRWLGSRARARGDLETRTADLLVGRHIREHIDRRTTPHHYTSYTRVSVCITCAECKRTVWAGGDGGREQVNDRREEREEGRERGRR